MFHNISLIGQSKHKPFEFANRDLPPDKTLAMKLLKEYTKPLLINTNSQASELLRKFGKYLNLLASLNNSVRVVEKIEF